MNVCQPASGVLSRPTPDAKNAHFIFVLSGSLSLPSASAEQVAPVTAERVRYNRDSLRISISGTCRRGLDAIQRQWGHWRGGSSVTAEGSSTAPETTDSDDATVAAHKRYAGAGNALCIPPSTQGVCSGSLSASTGGEKPTPSDTCDAVREGPASAHLWPEDCLEAVVLDSPESGCFVVHVTVPCSTPLLSPLLGEYRTRAVRRVVSEIQSGE